jgi:hypothetical protein
VLDLGSFSERAIAEASSGSAEEASSRNNARALRAAGT